MFVCHKQFQKSNHILLIICQLNYWRKLTERNATILDFDVPLNKVSKIIIGIF